MRRLHAATLLAAPLLALSLTAAARAEAPVFDPEAVRAHVTFLADDLLEGREGGSRGYDIAANYVASQYLGMGLQPVNGSYFQNLTLRMAKLDGTPALTLRFGGQELRIDDTAQVLIRPSLAEQQVALDAPLVFAGYGLDHPELGLKDYAGLDVKGKIVVVLSGYPKGMNSEQGAHLNAEKALMAMKRGAVGMITVPTLQETKRLAWDRRKAQAGSSAKGWVGTDGKAFVRASGIRAGATLNPETAAKLFAAVGKPLDAILAEADVAGKRPKGFALRASGRIEVASTWTDKPSANVVAMLPGSDPALADEVVVMTAHLDHIGDHGTAEDKIANGALDNASGVATMLEVAKALVKDKTNGKDAPRRPILFAAVTAEEGGLIGSDYLARNPVTGTGKPVAVVNFDMPVLLYRFTDVIAFGAEASTLGPIVAESAAKAGIRLSPDPLPEEGLFTRSDHYRFVQQGVPSVFLMTGFEGPGEKAFKDFLATHYHKPSDDLKLPIDWQAGAKFAEVNYHIIRGIADATEQPRWYAGNLFGKEFAPTAPKAPRP